MELRDTLKVNGVTVELLPYTEKRAAELNQVNADIDKYLEKSDADLKIEDVPKNKRADWWMRKAKILWQPLDLHQAKREGDIEGRHIEGEFFSKDFFSWENFEYPKLRKSEIFFMTQKNYL